MGKLRTYCAKDGVAVPLGFARNTPGRYAIIHTHLSPSKLIAQTRSKAADVLYYIKHFLQPELGDALSDSIRILDFHEVRACLHWRQATRQSGDILTHE